MNNVNQLASTYYQPSNSICLVAALGKLLFKFLFNLHSQGRIKSPLKQSTTGNRENEDVFYASTTTTNPKPFGDVLLIYYCEFHMKNPLSIFFTHFKEVFDGRQIQCGRSIESNVFLVNNVPICVNRIDVIGIHSTDIIFNSIINKCLKLLYSTEIVDLIKERELIGKMTNLNVSTEETEEYFQKQNDVRMNFITEDAEKIEELTCLTTNSSYFENMKKTKTSKELDSDSPDKRRCQPAGDIKKELNIFETKTAERQTSQLSRIVKAQMWVQNIKKRKIMNHYSASATKDCTKISQPPNIKPQPIQRTQNNSPDKSKRQRFIVKKTVDKNIDKKFGNLPTKIVNQKIKQRFIVLKQQHGPNTDNKVTYQNKPKTQNCSNKKKYVKFKDENCFSLIREDVINLANEIQKHYFNHSQNISSTTGSISLKMLTLDGQKRVDKDILFQEIKNRLQIGKKINSDEYRLLSDQSTTIATTSAMKLSLECNDKVLCKEDPSLISLSSSRNPLNSKFLTASDTTYKSIDSIFSANLDPHDLGEIRQMSDEIHNLVQRGLIKK